MIDIKTGEMEFDGVHINGNMKIEDFKEYAEKGLVHIGSDFGNGEGIARLTNKIESNGTLAKIKIEMLRYGTRITIYPEINAGEDLVSASKKWLSGMITDPRIMQYDNQIFLRYDWGYIVAQYLPDRDYGTVGGEIHIEYEVI